MQRFTLISRISAAVLVLFVAAGGCSSAEEDPEATETNVAPAPCDSDDDCPSHRCVGVGGEDGAAGSVLGFCEQPPGGNGPGAGGASSQ